MSRVYLVAAVIAAFASQAFGQAPNIAVDEFMVQSEPGIEVYVRNKRPADMTAFRPERTVLFVHGSTYPASTSWISSLAIHRGWTTSRRAVTTCICSTCAAMAAQLSEGNGRRPEGQSTARPRRDRREGHLRSC